MESIVGNKNQFATKIRSHYEDFVVKVRTTLKKMAMPYNAVVDYIAKKVPAPVLVIARKFVYDDYLAIFLTGLLSVFYALMTPFSGSFSSGMVSGCLILWSKWSYDFSQSDKQTLSKWGWYTHVSVKAMMVYKIIVIGVCIGIVTFTFAVTPVNYEVSTVQPNALTWMSQGECENFSKYSHSGSAKQCVSMQKAKEYTSAPFAVVRKTFDTDFTHCEYVLTSSKYNGETVLTKQDCGVDTTKKVTLYVEPYKTNDFFGPDYSYTVKMKQN